MKPEVSFLLQFALVPFPARVQGEVTQRINLPAVVPPPRGPGRRST